MTREEAKEAIDILHDWGMENFTDSSVGIFADEEMLIAIPRAEEALRAEIAAQSMADKDVQAAIDELQSAVRISAWHNSDYVDTPIKDKTLRTALIALRQMRTESCEVCGTKEQINTHGRIFYKEIPHDDQALTICDDSHLQLAYDDQIGWVLHFEDNDGEGMFDVKISSCPNCGRKLKPESET